MASLACGHVLDRGSIDRLYFNAARYKPAVLPQFSEISLNAKGTISEEFFAPHNYELAAKLFEEISLKEEVTDFLTITTYDYLD